MVQFFIMCLLSVSSLTASETQPPVRYQGFTVVNVQVWPKAGNARIVAYKGEYKDYQTLEEADQKQGLCVDQLFYSDGKGNFYIPFIDQCWRKKKDDANNGVCFFLVAFSEQGRIQPVDSLHVPLDILDEQTGCIKAGLYQRERTEAVTAAQQNRYEQWKAVQRGHNAFPEEFLFRD